MDAEILHHTASHVAPGTEAIHLAIEQISSIAAAGIGYIGVAIMCIGALRGLFEFIADFVRGEENLTDIRVDIAKHLSLGLEFLVGKDIIDTIIGPSFENLMLLSLIILIRTAIAYILSWELKEAIEIIEDEALFEEAVEKYESKRGHGRHKKHKSHDEDHDDDD